MTKHSGLTAEEARKKFSEFGLNEIHEVKKNSPILLLLNQVKKNYILYLLFAAAALSFIVGKSITAYTIITVIIVVVGVGFIQEYRAEKAISALKSMLMSRSRVMRDGKEVEIESTQIVPGDIVLLRAGEKVPADCMIIDEDEVRVDESVLTGESNEVKKSSGKNVDTASDEQKIYMGTFVISGKCVGQVMHTGMNTRFGGIAGMVSATQKSLPLQDKINKISTYMVAVALTISVLMGTVLFLRADTINPEFITSTLILMIALSVSAFPEGLPLVLIMTLANGVSKMAKKNAIVNRMSVIESLGETTVICTDKTGTITTGEMTVRKIVLDGKKIDVIGRGFSTDGQFEIGGKVFDGHDNHQFQELLKCSVACNDSKIEKTEIDHQYLPHGSTTEVALLIMAGKKGLFTEDSEFNRIEEMPFTSERKLMSVLVDDKDKRKVYVKGAPEMVLKHCQYYLEGNQKQKMTEKRMEELHEENKSMTSKALRTLALAYKEHGSDSKEYEEGGLIFLGIVGMEDPARVEAKDAVAACLKAGIKVKIITGDNKDTARAIAREVGIEGKVMTGEEIAALSDEELKDEVLDVALFVRVNPEHKLRIVKALKAHDEIVAMTGDGVNDAPALKEAHIGIAMGIKGTDVSRSVADIVLRDDNFATIVVAIAEGRTIFSNIRKFVSYQLSCNMAELMILFVGVLLAPTLGWEVPVLLAIQILFMNLVTDNLPALTLGFNPSSKDVLRARPRKKVQIMDRGIVSLIIVTGIIMCLVTLTTHFVSFNILGESADYARTQALVALICIEIATAFTFRSFRKKVLTRSPFVNRYLFIASAISVLATIVIVYTPAARVFETVPLHLNGWVIAAIAALCLVVVFDIGKEINKKFRFLPTR